MDSLVDGAELPDPEADLGVIVRFAHTYNGYERLSRSPSELLEVVALVLRPLDTTGRPPEWAGVDLLRGALFYVARSARFLGWDSEEDETRMRALVARIREIRSDVELANDAQATA